MRLRRGTPAPTRDRDTMAPAGTEPGFQELGSRNLARRAAPRRERETLRPRGPWTDRPRTRGGSADSASRHGRCTHVRTTSCARVIHRECRGCFARPVGATEGRRQNARRVVDSARKRAPSQGRGGHQRLRPMTRRRGLPPGRPPGRRHRFQQQPRSHGAAPYPLSAGRSRQGTCSPDDSHRAVREREREGPRERQPLRNFCRAASDAMQHFI